MHQLDEFINDMEQSGIPLHSVAVIHKGKVLEERYLGGFTKDSLHRMYSITKSFVSVAIGLLEQEGKLCLTDPILNYFEEYKMPGQSQELREMTIEDMLKMQTCYVETTYKKNHKEPWLPSFFTAQSHHKPGMIFMYDTSAAHTMCALAEKLSGKRLMDYLRQKVLDEIGFSKEAYCMENQFHETIGGGGLMAKTSDMVKFAQLLMNDGMCQGRQLLPLEYMKKATSLQAATNIKGAIIEERQGYGYQFWRFTHNGFGCYGKGGQLILCYPDHELAVVTTADTTGIQGGNQLIYNGVYRHLLSRLEKSGKIHDFGSGSKQAGNIDWIFGHTYICRENSIFKCLRFEKDKIVFATEEKQYELAIGWEKEKKGLFPVYDDPCVTKVTMVDDRTLYIRSEILGENLACFEMQAAFKGDDLCCAMKNTQDFDYEEFSGWIKAERE